ncbi:Solute carrier family 23 member 2 [Toxocara canis]|uniref:Solute carrier family 23 member 2 n=1 Tax=Toxocara canis TaxID=6265 RepID=A0A0B2UXX7_TOXCA|nr:Solute carrier family 23 member 2 [Toxocara canis]
MGSLPETIYLIAILASWGFCLFLTLSKLVPPDSAARLDKNETLAVIRHAEWFRVPYPGQYGAPKFHTGLFLAFVVSALTSVFESVGDYHAAARVSEERAPPSHAINRGILAEGSGSLLAGLLGPGVGMTTHTENIGVIGVTRVSKETVFLTLSRVFMIEGLSKLGSRRFLWNEFRSSSLSLHLLLLIFALSSEEADHFWQGTCVLAMDRR